MASIVIRVVSVPRKIKDSMKKFASVKQTEKLCTEKAAAQSESKAGARSVGYLVCTIKTYSDLKILAVHRVQSANLLDTPSYQLEGFTLDGYLATGAFGWQADLTVQFEALFSVDAGNHLYETPLSTDQTITVQDDGRLRVAATIQYTQQLVWWLL